MVGPDCQIPKDEWAREVGEGNGVSFSRGKHYAPNGVDDVGLWRETVQQIVGFRDLGNNWDGFGAEPPTGDLLASAVGLAYCYQVKGVLPPQRVAPGVCGSVIFEWQDPDGTYAEVEIDSPLHAEIMIIEPGKEAKHWTIPGE
jgi:hypothetical protein